MPLLDFINQVPENPFLESPPSDVPDKYTATCIEAAKLNKANLINKALKEDIEARRLYANRAFYLVVCWLIAMLIILLLQGFLGHGEKTISGEFCGVTFSITEPNIFFLPEAVLIAAISGTTVSVIGIFVVVMNYLFPNRFRKSN